jgi:hypothetical protein
VLRGVGPDPWRRRPTAALSMALEFLTLDITRGPQLPKEADKIVRLFAATQKRYETATTKAEKSALEDAMEAMRTSVEQRVEELEDFYIEHDNDERAILFEKQRLRLRRLLHDEKYLRKSHFQKPPPPKPEAAQPKKEPPVRWKPPNPKPQKKKKNKKLPKSYEREPLLAYSTNKSPKARFQKQLRAEQAKMKSRVEPIYDWEKPDGGKKQPVKLMGPLEFELRMTQQEFFKFTSKRREAIAVKKHKLRNRKYDRRTAPFIQSQGPYVDPTRISNSIYREVKKENWMDPQGFVPSMRIDRLKW